MVTAIILSLYHQSQPAAAHPAPVVAVQVVVAPVAEAAWVAVVQVVEVDYP